MCLIVRFCFRLCCVWLVKAMEKVSVVISVYSKDRLRYLLGCIDSLRRQSVKPLEVIVVLNLNPDLVEFYKSRGFSDEGFLCDFG